jgi:hypothetical protein
MAKQEAKVKVRLDTREAKGDLRGLSREASRTAGRVGAGLRGAVSQGMGLGRSIGIGAGIGTGLAAVKGASSSGFGDVIGEAFGGIGASLNEFFLGDVDDKARASKAAREETIQAFGAIAGHTGQIPPGATNFFNQVRSVRMEEERGRSMFEQDDRFRGPGIMSMLERIMEGIGELLSDAVDALADKLNPFS